MCNFKIIIFSFIFILAGCGKPPFLNKLEKVSNEISSVFPYEDIEFTLNWTVPPTLSELSSLEINLNKPMEDGISLNAYLWMPEMGHGSSPIEIQKINSTNYALTDLAFIMPGLWVLHIELIENNRIVHQWQKSITL